MVALIPAGMLWFITSLLMGAAERHEPSGGNGGLLCLAVPISAFALIAGLLGMTEEAPDGNRRATTCAKVALLMTAGCWLIGTIMVIFVH